MRYTVGQLVQDADSYLHTGSIDAVQDFGSTLDRARRKMIRKIAPPEMRRQSLIEQAVYNNIEKYAVPEDMNYNNVVDLKLLASRRNVDTLNYPLKQVFSRRSMQKRTGARNVFNIEFLEGQKFIRLVSPLGTQSSDVLNEATTSGAFTNNNFVFTNKLIHACDSLDQNGTWNTGGNITNLRVDNLNFVDGNGSLSFDINDSSTTGFIENFTLNSFDLESFFAKGAVFNWFNFQELNKIVSVRMTLGSNTTNLTTDLYQFSVNQPHDGNAFSKGWNLLRYPLREVAQVGNPNPRDLKYIRVDITTVGTDNIPNCRMDAWTARDGAVYELTYNSAFCFIDPVTLAWRQRYQSTADLLPFEEDTFDILSMEVALDAQKELYASSGQAKYDVTDLESQLRESYALYKMAHPNEIVLPTDSVYTFGNQYDGYQEAPLEGDSGIFYA